MLFRSRDQSSYIGGHVNFQVGDKVIYPNHGLGIVERVEEKTILGTTCGFFHLRIVSNDTTVLVPVANVDGVGLRKAITDEEVERLFQLLGDGKIDNHQNWKGRFKDNSDKMRTGSIYDMADVLKSLTFLAKSKSLSFREKRMLDRAKFLVVSEISEVMGQKAVAIEKQVEEALVDEELVVVQVQVREDLVLVEQVVAHGGLGEQIRLSERGELAMSVQQIEELRLERRSWASGVEVGQERVGALLEHGGGIETSSQAPGK